VRGSSDFRYQLAENILLKFFYETADERELACL
jgi:xanthine dehydrogenase iron-sulfur cluster and FAD-binding subunit A